MVFLSKALPYGANRMTNMVMAGLTAVAIVAGGSTDSHFLVFASAELIGLSLIAWKAWKWETPATGNNHGFGMRMRPDGRKYGLAYSYGF